MTTFNKSILTIYKNDNISESEVYTRNRKVIQNLKIPIALIHHINRMKENHYMIISTAIEKALRKIQHTLMIKILSHVGPEQILLSLIWLTS